MSKQIEAAYIKDSVFFKDFEKKYRSILFEQWQTADTVEEREIVHDKLLGIDFFMAELTAEIMRYNNG